VAHLLDLGVDYDARGSTIVAGRAEGLIGIRFTRQRDFTAEEKELAQLLAKSSDADYPVGAALRPEPQTAIVEERNRLAREIHDTLAQGFTGVIAQLGSCKGSNRAEEKPVRVSDHSTALVSWPAKGSGRRDGPSGAAPLALEEKPLSKALLDLIERMTTGMAMTAKFTLSGEPRKLPSEWETHLLRIGQEALTNAIRHAEAQKFHCAP